MKKVIDVSKWNAITNFELVSQNIDGVIIRAGFRGANNNAEIQMDSRFLAYSNELSKYNVPLGAYFTTSAINTDEAAEEATFFINAIKSAGITFKLQLFLNSDWGTSSHNGRADKIEDVNLRTEILLAFIKCCEKQGYECGLFASDQWLLTKLIPYKLKDINKIVTRTIDYDVYFDNVVADRFTDPFSIKGIAGYINLSKWYDEKPFTVAEAPKRGRKSKKAVEPVEEPAVAEETPVEEPVVEEEPKAKPKAAKKKEYKVGSAIVLVDEPVYKTSVSSTVLYVMSGKYYVYNAKILNHRIRIADKKVNGELIGWITLP